MKNIMKRAWEIYRTLVGDHIAKLSMALRKAWSEVKNAKTAVIEGLDEIRKAKEDVSKWQYEFNRSFNGEYACGGMGVRPKPNYDFAALYKKYPIARDFLRAEAQSHKYDYQLAAIGQTALDAIIKNPADHENIIAEMELAIEQYAERAMFDC